LTGDADLADELAADYTQANINAAEKTMLDYAAKLTREPWNMVEADVITMREAGWSDSAILDTNQVTAYYAYANRLVDGLGVELEDIHAKGE